jgi:hypothetical protein
MPTRWHRLINLVVGLPMVLGIPLKQLGVAFDGFGFAACPWVTVGAEYLQFAFFMAFIV